MRIARLDGNGGQPAGGELVQTAVHGADPQRALAILPQRHDVFVAQRIGSADQGVHVDRGASGGIELLEAGAHRSDPDAIVGCIGEGLYVVALQPGGPSAAQLPAARVPTADASCARADPYQAAVILIQREDVRIRQCSGIVWVVRIVMELATGPIQQVEPLGSTNP